MGFGLGLFGLGLFGLGLLGRFGFCFGFFLASSVNKREARQRRSRSLMTWRNEFSEEKGGVSGEEFSGEDVTGEGEEGEW